MEIITLGIGTPSSIPHLVLCGLSPSGVVEELDIPVALSFTGVALASPACRGTALASPSFEEVALASPTFADVTWVPGE